jgi:GT2 family glycosyltransferase
VPPSRSGLRRTILDTPGQKETSDPGSADPPAQPKPVAIALPHSPEPRVSVIIPSSIRTDLLLRCLQSIEQYGPRGIAYETIVVLNEVDAAVEAKLRQTVSGAAVVRSPVNLGLAGAGNLGRSLARGEFLLLLHDDVEVLPGWMEALVETADAHPDAGAIGSKILFPDGRLQNSGAILWSNALTSFRWAGEAPDPNAFDQLELVDYCATCSLLVRTSAFDAAGGFDEDFFPAIYVDVDLCTALRCAGHLVMWEPRSQIRHHRHASTESRFRRFVWLRNKARFQDKWAAALEQQEPFDDVSTASIERAMARTRAAAKRAATCAKELSQPRTPDPALQQAENSARAYALQKAFAEDLRAAVEDAEADRVNLREQNASLARESRELQTAYAALGDEYATERVLGDRLRNTIAELEANHNRLSQAHEMLTQQHREIADAHEALSDKHQQLEQTQAAGAAKLRELEQAHNALVAERRDLLQMHAALAREHHELQRRHEGMRRELQQAHQTHEMLADQHAALERTRDALMQSRSWRITAPLRYLSMLLRGRT